MANPTISTYCRVFCLSAKDIKKTRIYAKLVDQKQSSDVETDRPIIEVKIVGGTVWMTVNEIADLFGVYTPTISKHLKAIFKDNLLRES